MSIASADLPTRLPALRQELALHAGPADSNGVPTWTLHDPSDNRFFQLSWPAFEILVRWPLGNAQALLAAIEQETTLQVGEEDIADLLAFLTHHNLLAASSAQDSTRLAHVAAASRMSNAMWLLKHYLFFRVPLVRPMPFLRAVLPHISWFFTPTFWRVMLGVALLGLYFVSQQWDSFTGTFAAYSGWQGLLGIGVALSVAKVAHELGHAFTAYRHGCRVPHMGAAFLVMVPVLYTDTNEAWKLQSRRQRLQIGVAGMAAEVALAACATLLWNFLPDGALRAGVFLLATSTWLITLAINTSPFMRFDGYFLLSDLLDMPNLHERTFALARWRMREWLFAWGDEAPEAFSPNRQRFLIAFAYAIWIYRLVLFLGIAFLVYHLFFKALGIVLLGVELGWFIAYPIVREIAVWWRRRHELQWNRSTRRSSVLALFFIAIVIIPWPRGESAPAVLGAVQAQWLYAPAAAQVSKVHAVVGQTVKAGDTLVELDSPELRNQLGIAEARERQLRWQVQQQSFNEQTQQRGATVQQTLDAARTEVAGLQSLTDQLQLRANFDGKVVADNPALQPGAWIPRGEKIMQIANPRGIKVDAYVDEQAFAQIRSGASARFVADQPGLPHISCAVEDLDRIALGDLEQVALTSPYGGPIAAKRGNDGYIVPLEATFRVRLNRCDGMPGTQTEIIGSAIIGNSHQSFLGEWLRRIFAAVQREGGL
jgi:putative peptide zinc metalloprotease protein